MTNHQKPSSSSSGEHADRQTRAPFQVSWTHRLMFTRDALDPLNPLLRDAVVGSGNSGSDRGMIAVIDGGVIDGNPEFMTRLEQHIGGRSDMPELREVMRAEGGESCKNDSTLVDEVLDAIDRNRICRKSTVLVVGGGAVLDAAGYAASIAHRGVRLVRMPSTVLSQCDSGVGVKNGINRFGKKNFIGTFVPPNAVLCDFDLLESLDDREWICGFSEIVKIALLKDLGLLETIEDNSARIVGRENEPSHAVISRSAELHLDHITAGGDPFELEEARPLDFGHWAAHKLEQMTDFSLPHGEAVSIGMALDSVYAELAGVSHKGLAERTLKILESLRLPVAHPAMARTDELLGGLDEFQEHLGGRLTITLIPTPGSQIDVHEIDDSLVRKSVQSLLDRLPS